MSPYVLQHHTIILDCTLSLQIFRIESVLCVRCYIWFVNSEDQGLGEIFERWWTRYDFIVSYDLHFVKSPSERLFVSVRRFNVGLSTILLCECYPRTEIETVSVKGWWNKLNSCFCRAKTSRELDSIPWLAGKHTNKRSVNFYVRIDAKRLCNFIVMKFSVNRRVEDKTFSMGNALKHQTVCKHLYLLYFIFTNFHVHVCGQKSIMCDCVINHISIFKDDRFCSKFNISDYYFQN